MMPIITITTDFGLSDPFVGVMKGVILGIAPGAEIVDLTHHVPPQNLVAAAVALESSFHYFPKGTIHVVVVDPGVGSERAAVAAETEDYTFVGPDNGIISAALAGVQSVRRAVRLTNSDYHRSPVSKTFHGRDIFAPVAGHLAAGVPIERLGEPHSPLAELSMPRPHHHGAKFEAHVVYVDRFGNLVTDVMVADLRAYPANHVTLELGGRTITGISTTYADVSPGELLAYLGSGGRLEIAVREGNAAQVTGLNTGATFFIRRVTGPVSEGQEGT